MQGNVHDKNFQDAWCSGMLIGEAFISWDLRYTLWLWDYCIVDLFQSRFIRVFSSLPNAKALDEVLSDRGVKEAVHGAVNPLWGLRDLSNLARCYSACREDHPGRKTTELELVVVIRLHNRDFYQSAIEKHDLMMTGKPDSSGHPQHRAGFADNDIHDYSSDFLEKVVDTSVVNECIRDGQTINLLKTIAYAAATEQSTQNYIKSEIDQNYTVSIHAFNYASHFNKWETVFLELNRKIGSRERRASTSIQNLDETMSVIYDCVWDIVESYQEDA